MDGFVTVERDMKAFYEELAIHHSTQRTLESEGSGFSVVPVDAVTALSGVLLDDTRMNSRLCLKVGEEYIPLRACAVNSLNTICGVKGGFLARLTPAEHADLLNDFAIRKFSSKKKVRLFEQDGKVTGVLGGTTYKEIPAIRIFEETKDFMDSYFPRYHFRAGYFSHAIILFGFDLSEHADEFGAVLEGIRLKPVFWLQTSDCGLSSVTIRPYLKDGNADFPVNPLRILHKGKTTDDALDEVREALNQCYSLIDKGLNEVRVLADIRIDHPHTTLLRVMKACKINQAAALTVAEIYRDSWGMSCTALDLFRCICETQMYLPPDQSIEQRFRTSDDIARTAAVNWKKYDLPGDFTW